MGINKFDILVVDDEKNIRRAVELAFRGEDFDVDLAADGLEALEKCRAKQYHVAIIDMRMPNMDGETLLKKIKTLYPETSVIILTGFGSIESAVDMIKIGAADYLTKPFKREEVLEKVRRICKVKTLEQENTELKAQLQDQQTFKNLIGRSLEMQKIHELVELVSRNDSTILIQGESGTGKEQIARAIHRNSPRNKEPFIPVDCGSISNTLMESELFGHVKGAFTGAQRDTEGLLRAAGEGTIFFDEIGELPVSVQAKLLRSLQEREVRPVGGTETFPINARLIAATNRDLEKAVAEGDFREDLFYRLNVVKIKVPPLRDRLEDIPMLVQFLLGRLQNNGYPEKQITPEALKLLANYAWPGNIRELDNALAHATSMGMGDFINPEDLPESLRPSGSDENAERPAFVANGSLKSYEKQAITEALSRANGNKRNAANILKIGEATLYRKIKEYNIE